MLMPAVLIRMIKIIYLREKQTTPFTILTEKLKKHPLIKVKLRCIKGRQRAEIVLHLFYFLFILKNKLNKGSSVCFEQMKWENKKCMSFIFSLWRNVNLPTYNFTTSKV